MIFRWDDFGSFILDLDFLFSLDFLDDIINKSSMHKFDSMFYPQIVGYFGTDHSVVSVCALDIWLLVLRFI